MNLKYQRNSHVVKLSVSCEISISVKTKDGCVYQAAMLNIFLTGRYSRQNLERVGGGSNWT